MIREKRRSEMEWAHDRELLDSRKPRPYLIMRDIIVQPQCNRDDDIEYNICQHSNSSHSELGELYIQRRANRPMSISLQFVLPSNYIFREFS